MSALSTIHELDPAPRILLGPGPSMVPPRVLRALATPPTGHLDPDFLVILDDVRCLLQFVFQTQNELTLAVPGTGTAGMEAVLSNLIEPGDSVLACAAGYFGERLAAMAERHGAEVERLERSWGQVFGAEEIHQAVQRKAYKLVTLVHAETSTGAWQPDIPAIARDVHASGALLVLDVVTSLGGLPVEIDAWDIDAAYGASQKCLSAPSGLSPVTLGARARAVIAGRRRPPSVFYLDLESLLRYWGEPHAYHHTSPIQTFYGLHEALRLVYQEGLQARFERHQRLARSLWSGLESLGLEMLMPEAVRLPTLTTPLLPPGVNDAEIRTRLREEFNLEIAGGFGALAGRVWRIGLMGHSCRAENVVLLLAALEATLRPAKG
ncbi:MAG: alanine--glyoxylate aminotransferase family protein [Anaerolineales bacterium]|nr:alanine--glyoxylate aminotransferase family protein [Anaerolineales bacterium]